MQVVILAGGLGTRMLPRTETVPKPLLPVCGKPFLDHQIRLLVRAGYGSFLLLIGYLGEQIEDYFRTAGVPALIQYCRETTSLGTGGALANASALLEDEFLLLNGDTYLDIDYPAFTARFRTVGCDACVAVFPAGRTALHGNITLDDKARVLAYNKRERSGTHLDAGVLAAKKRVVQLIPHERPTSFEENVFPKLAERAELAAWETPTPYFDMGTPEGLAALEEHLR